jgi:hypothetical protein
MMIPASSSPRSDRPPTWKLAPRASSLVRPVSAVAVTNPADSAAVSSRANAVLTLAAVVLRPTPWER